MAVIEYDGEGKAHNASGKRIATTISIPQLYRRFPDDAACRAWLEEVRWGGKVACPHCGGMDNFTRPASKPHAYWHKDCRKSFTVTTGTVMHATKADLQHWIYAIYSVLTARKGVSALQFSKELGVQYRTAWHMLHRVREACGRGEFTLGNVVEVDETYIGGKEGNKHAAKKLNAGRGAVGKQAIAGVRERGGKVKAQPVERTNAATLIPLHRGQRRARGDGLHRRCRSLRRTPKHPEPVPARRDPPRRGGVRQGRRTHQRHRGGVGGTQAQHPRHLAPCLPEAS
ncbi:MAG: IS1595 family transposase [Gammaproteobacteria bacterium]|nr:IS1595 family transposase [Gammaproteobacteria bacterium]